MFTAKISFWKTFVKNKILLLIHSRWPTTSTSDNMPATEVFYWNGRIFSLAPVYCKYGFYLIKNTHYVSRYRKFLLGSRLVLLDVYKFFLLLLTLCNKRGNRIIQKDILYIRREEEGSKTNFYILFALGALLLLYSRRVTGKIYQNKSDIQIHCNVPKL